MWILQYCACGLCSYDGGFLLGEVRATLTLISFIVFYYYLLIINYQSILFYLACLNLSTFFSISGKY